LFLQCLHLSVCTYSVYKHVVPTSQIDINNNKIPLTSSSDSITSTSRADGVIALY
jgi:hypothetical protein